MKRISNIRAIIDRINSLLNYLPFVKYMSVEGCQQRLLAVFAADGMPNDFLIYQAVESRKKELKWFWLYLPFALFGFCMLYLIAIALIRPGTRYAYVSIALVFMLLVVFRITFYNGYLDICKNLVLAAEGLLRNIPSRTDHVGLELTKQPLEMPYLDVPAQAVESILPVLEERTNETIAVQGIAEADRRELSGLAKVLPKKHGRICMALIDQLLRYKCGRPSIYDNHLPLDTKSFARLIGCGAKNVKDKMNDYRELDSIKKLIKTEEAKTTHLRYVEILREFYKNPNDSDLFDAANKLRADFHCIKVPLSKN